MARWVELGAIQRVPLKPPLLPPPTNELGTDAGTKAL